MTTTGNDLRKEAALAVRLWMSDHPETEFTVCALLPLAGSLLWEEGRDPVETIRDANDEIYRGFRLGSLVFAADCLHRVDPCRRQMAALHSIAEASSTIVVKPCESLRHLDAAAAEIAALLKDQWVTSADFPYLDPALAALRLARALTTPSVHNGSSIRKEELPADEAVEFDRARMLKPDKRPALVRTPA